MSNVTYFIIRMAKYSTSGGTVFAREDNLSVWSIYVTIVGGIPGHSNGVTLS